MVNDKANNTEKPAVKLDTIEDAIADFAAGRMVIVVDDEDHVAAAAAVAAVGATERHQRLTPERRRAVATLARTHEHVHLIYECLVFHADSIAYLSFWGWRLDVPMCGEPRI